MREGNMSDQLPPLPVPPFNIACMFHEGAHTDEAKFAGWKPGPDEWLYLEISTPVNKWNARVRRGDMAKLFEAINANLPTPIEFGKQADTSKESRA